MLRKVGIVTSFEKRCLMKTRREESKGGKHLGTRDLTLIGVFSALWIVLHLTIGPLGFTLFRLPVLCDVAAYSTLLLAVWTLGKLGGALLVGIIGSVITLLLRPGAFQILGFAASAVIFDILCLTVRHEVSKKPVKIVALAVVTIVSAYFAGAVIGLIFMAGSLEWSLTYWAGWHAVGGLLSVIITLPVIAALERANVRRLIYGGAS